MKQIIFLRHAHTEAFHMQGDHARELSGRGIIQAKQIADTCDMIDGLRIILASGAVRTLQTAEIIQESSKREYQLISSDALYLASASDIFNVIAQLDDGTDKVMIVGHNPGISDAIEQLLTKDIWDELQEGVPPCTLVHIESNAEIWRDIETNNATLKHYVTP